MSYQVSLYIDGKKLIPAPFVSFTRLVERSTDGTSRRRGWRILLTGQVVAFSGSPDNTGAFWTSTGYPPAPSSASNDPEHRLANLRNKLNAITQLFDGDGQLLEIQPGDGTATISARLRVAEVKYDQGKWFDTVPFTVEAEADCVHFGAYDPEADECRLGRTDNPPEESWSLEAADEAGRSYKLVHTISAAAKKRFDDTGLVLAEGWQVARSLVLGQDDPQFPTLAGDGLPSLLGFNQGFLTAAGVLDLTTFQPFDYRRSQQVDEGQGRFQVTETWLCVDPTATQPSGQTAGKALEELTVETRYGSDTGLFAVTVNGTITGLEERNNTTRALIKSRWDNAKLRFDPIYADSSIALGLAQDQSGKTLNPSPLSSTVMRNKVTGVIQWSVSFDNRPASQAGYVSENYQVSIDRACDVFAEIGVINRPAGPVLQPIGSTTRKAVTITADILVAVQYGQTLPSMPATDPLTAALGVIGTVPTQLFVASDRDNWDARRGRYSRTTTYIYQ